jgi:superkiller protein 3
MNPRYWTARANLGMLLYRAGQFEDALREFEVLLQGQPHLQRPRVSKGWALLSLDRYAVEVFKEATRHDPEDPKAWYGLGVAEDLQGTGLAAAKVALARAAELDPRYTDAVCRFGEVQLRTGEVDPAVETLRACVDLDPKSGKRWAWLGLALQQQGSTEQAIAAYRGALEMDPSNAYAKEGLATLTGQR